MTNKEVRRVFDKVYSIGYGAMQFLLRFENRIGYNCGIYGWNYDVYSLGNGICICTGYRNMPGKTIPYELVQKYDKYASEILSEVWGKWDEKRKRMQALIKDFLGELECLNAGHKGK